MDRELPPEKVTQRKRKRILAAISAMFGVIVILYLFNQLITFPLKRSEILTAKAIRGDINATLNATGTILPEFEEVITSPIQTRIRKVLVATGSAVDSGGSILELDLSALNNQINQSADQLNLFMAQYEKSRLSLEKTISDLENQRDIKKLRNKWYEVEAENAEKLFSIGGATREEVKKAALDLEIARLELAQLENQITNLRESKKAQLQELTLNIRIQERMIDELKQRLDQSRIAAGRNGVITWLKDQIGSNVDPGETVARVADLTSYKVEGTISDIYANRIFQGQEALIRINDLELKGTIVSIQPAVKNGFIQFMVSLADKSNPLLRPHLQVDLFPVTSSKKNVVLLPNEAAFSGAKEQFLFVIENGKAFRRTVTTGLTNYDFVEIVSGIEPGEEVIVSNMKENERRKSIQVK